MELVERIQDWSLTTLGLILVVVMMLAREAGYRLGVRRARHAEKPDEGVAVLIGSLLGLMSFVLAFNLSTSTARLEDRRSASLEEATAISTAWLQARAVSEAQGAAIARLLKDYLSSRRTFAAAPEGDPAIDSAASATTAMQTAIWREMVALFALRTDQQTVSLSNALTHAFDTATAQNLAIGTGLPPRLVWLLLISSALAIWGLGYYLGLVGRPRLALSMVLAVLWSGVMMLILDLGTPRVGTINTDVRPYDWATESIAAFD